MDKFIIVRTFVRITQLPQPVHWVHYCNRLMQLPHLQEHVLSLTENSKRCNVTQEKARRWSSCKKQIRRRKTRVSCYLKELSQSILSYFGTCKITFKLKKTWKFIAFKLEINIGKHQKIFVIYVNQFKATRVVKVGED